MAWHTMLSVASSGLSLDALHVPAAVMMVILVPLLCLMKLCMPAAWSPLQVSAIPRLVATSGQGYGYAVAWSLAQLLQPAMLHHIKQAAALQCAPLAQDAAGGSSTSPVPGADHVSVHPQQQQQQVRWRQVLATGVQSTGVQQLVEIIAQLQLQDQLAHGQQQCMADSSSPSGLVTMLQKHGMWPVDEGVEPADLLVVCLECSLNNVRPR